jgi:hypothetical protein
VKELIRAVLVAQLEEEQSYSDDSVPALCSTVCDAVKQKLKAAGLDRYKFVVQVFIGEQEGAGIRMEGVSTGMTTRMARLRRHMTMLACKLTTACRRWEWEKVTVIQFNTAHAE